MDGFYRNQKDWHRAWVRVKRSRSISAQNKGVIESFIQRLLAESISPLRIKKYIYYLGQMARIVDRPFQSWQQQDFERLLAELQSRDYAPYTVNDYRVTIKKFFRFVLGSGYRQEDFRWIKTGCASQRRLSIGYGDLLTKEEIKALVQRAPSPMHKSLISLAYETAARPSELLTLTVGSVQLAEGFSRVFIRESKTFVRPIYSVDSDRYLKAWLNMHPFKGDLASPLFPSSYLGTRSQRFLKPESFNSVLKRLAARLGITKRVYSYLLRHTRITHLLEADWNEVMIKKLVGHTLDSKAFKVYEHLAQRHVEEYVLVHSMQARQQQKAQGVVESKTCVYCKTENGLDSDTCVQCDRAVSVRGLMESQEREKELLRMLTPEIIDALITKKVDEAIRARSAQSWQEVG